jgi:hypothetical protein
MRCPNCEGFLLREPASVRCLACGCRWEIFDANDAARLRQRLIDWERRPRSVECLPEFEEIVAAPPRGPRRGLMKLPGHGRQNGARESAARTKR